MLSLSTCGLIAFANWKRKGGKQASKRARQHQRIVQITGDYGEMHPLSGRCKKDLIQGRHNCFSRRLKTHLKTFKRPLYLKDPCPVLGQLSLLPSAHHPSKSEQFQCEILLQPEYKGFPCLCSSGKVCCFLSLPCTRMIWAPAGPEMAKNSQACKISLENALLHVSPVTTARILQLSLVHPDKYLELEFSKYLNNGGKYCNRKTGLVTAMF